MPGLGIYKPKLKVVNIWKCNICRAIFHTQQAYNNHRHCVVCDKVTIPTGGHTINHQIITYLFKHLKYDTLNRWDTDCCIDPLCQREVLASEEYDREQEEVNLLFIPPR